MLKPVAIDLSHWNTVIGSSYTAAKSSLQRCLDSGILGVIHKASEGTSFRDDKLQARADLCRDVGLMFGTYHFLRPNDIDGQVSFYYDTVMNIIKVNGESLQWVWACDFEDPKITLDQVADFMEKLDYVLGDNHHPVLYTGFALKDKIAAGQDASRLTKYLLWLAHYANSPVLPKGWNKYWLWQYSDKASVPGIEAPTDVNAFDGPVEDFVKSWNGATAVTPEPAPPIDLTSPTEIKLNIPAGVEATVTVNGIVVYKQ